MRNRTCFSGCVYFLEGRCVLENCHNRKKPECEKQEGTHGVAL
jgi:collagenase-like PrtC family protease